jgi:hypothetical protein
VAGNINCGDTSQTRHSHKLSENVPSVPRFPSPGSPRFPSKLSENVPSVPRFPSPGSPSVPRFPKSNELSRDFLESSTSAEVLKLLFRKPACLGLASGSEPIRY